MEQKQNKKDKWIPRYFIAFFVVLAILDGIFVTIATSTHTGLVTENAYQKGLDYNKSITAVEKQNALGWHSEITFNNPSLVLNLKNNNKTAIKDAKVIAYFIRATQEGYDFSSPLTHIGDGLYNQDITFPLKGQWDIRIIATSNKQQYQQHKKIIIK